MKFADVPAGASLFVDANVFIYALLRFPRVGELCERFVERVARGELRAATSSHVLSNVAHRLMTVEACTKWNIPYAGIARHLQRHPEQVKELHTFQEAVQGIEQIQVELLPVTEQHVFQATEISRQHGLLSNDALIVAMMQSSGLTLLASSDADFDIVPGITRVVPE